MLLHHFLLLTLPGLIACATFLFAGGDQREKNRWVEVKIKTDTLKTKYFDAFIALPRGDDSLRALCAALPNGSVWYSPDGYGRQWIRTRGLEKIKVNTLMTREEGINGVYACTDSGLFHFAGVSLSWKRVGAQWLFGSMNAVCFGPPPDSAIYVASGNRIFRLKNRSGYWKQIQPGITSADSTEIISALFVSPADTTYLIVGTDKCVYTVQIKADSVLMDESSPGSPPQIKAFAVGNFNEWNEKIVAITEAQGAYYCSDAFGRIWLPMSNGLQKDLLGFFQSKKPMLSGLALDSYRSTKTCVATTRQKKVMQMKFYGMRVGVFEVSSLDMNLSEVRRFGDRLFHGLAVPEIVELTRLPSLASSSSESLDVRLSDQPDLRQYELFIWGEIGTNLGVDNKATKQIQIMVRRRSGLDTAYVRTKVDYDKYYPREAEKLAKQIKRIEFKVSEPSLMNKFLWQGRRKIFTLGAAFGLGAHILAELLEKDEPPPNSKLPMPPKFP